jgi:uncharacterized repeat protein (TIGR03847 family)
MIREFRRPERFTVGTVGMPGDRTFFIQLRAGNTLLSMSLEKSQVSVLAERLRFMLKEIGESNLHLRNTQLQRDSLPLENPVLEEFRIGSIALYFDASTEEIQIDLRELKGDVHDSEDDIEIDNDVEIVRIFLSTEQILTFSDRAELVVAAGRKPCPFCGLPINVDGHLCARANGYRR